MNIVLNILIVSVPWICSITSLLMLINNKTKLDPMLKEDIYNTRKLNIFIVYVLQFLIILITITYYLIHPLENIKYSSEEFSLMYLCLFLVVDFIPLVIDIIVAIMLINNANKRKIILSKKSSKIKRIKK